MATNRLGKGLDALFADTTGEAENASELSVNDITPDRNQPRHAFDDAALEELAASIREHGVLQPILVRPIPEGGYRIVAGERRWRAAKKAGLSMIPALVRPLTESDAVAIALIENLQREDLNPVEEARGYKRLIDEFMLTQEQAADRVGKSRPTVANALRLLSLPDDAIELLEKGKLSAGHAKAVLSALPERMSELARQIAAEGLSVRAAEKLCSQKSKPDKPEERQPKPADPTAKEVELSLAEALGVEVKVRYEDGRGTLSVGFYSKEQLYDFANRLGK